MSGNTPIQEQRTGRSQERSNGSTSRDSSIDSLFQAPTANHHNHILFDENSFGIADRSIVSTRKVDYLCCRDGNASAKSKIITTTISFGNRNNATPQQSQPGGR